MTEFLKNNPIALRHCLLYQFLQKKSVGYAFFEFRETVGPDVIKIEEFQLCFDQFEQGKFGDNEEPVTDMRDILRNDKQALRVCVMYEFLSAKRYLERTKHFFIKTRPLPVYTRYMNFCKVIGDDVMDYREFEFWFYRFFNGVYDLSYERDEDEKIHELMNIPIDIMRNIVEYLDIGDRSSLERTSRTLRLFSQGQKVFHSILSFEPGWHNSLDIIYGARDTINYKGQGNDCVIEFRNRQTVLRDVSFLNQAFQDFQKILENPKLYVNRLLIRVTNSNSAERGIEDALKFPHLLRVNHLTVCAQSMKTLLNILSLLEPGYLTRISLNIDPAGDIREVVETEQWKQAKYLNMSFNRFVGPLIDLYHFREFRISLSELRVVDIRQMKEVLFKSPHFKKCLIRLFTPLNMDTLRHGFGDAIQGIPSIYHYPIPNSMEYFEMILNRMEIKITRKNQ